jgi:prepilin-type N-terminal cleavage/methylation domain-containing protein
MLISANLKTARVSRRPSAGFTLIEVMIAFAIFGMVTAGILYGYVEANRVAEWSSMSLGAQSYASMGIERARAAKWDTQANNEVSADFLPVPLNPGYTNWWEADTNDVPQSGAPLIISNKVTITNISTNSPFLRQIESDVIWRFPLTGQYFTNTIMTLRAPDQ